MRTLMHINPLIFVIVGLVLGVGLFALSRRTQNGQRLFRLFMAALTVIIVALLTVDFITTPGQRWVSGAGLLGALVAAGGYGYQRLQGSKTRS
jgi:peptidoglycan/LPS O-acetylase OafA/YrhL